MPIFFVSPDQMQTQTAVIRGADVHHISRVLRLSPGDSLKIHDGRGHHYAARIESVAKSEVRLEILSRDKIPEPKIRLVVGQAIPKGKKMEWVVQKSTEMGVDTLVPLTTRRVISSPGSERTEKKLERWRSIAEEAAKQSGRFRIPDVRPVMDIPAFAEEFESVGLKLMCWEAERKNRIRTVLGKTHPVRDAAVVIGPEGGFDLAEVESLRAAGFISVGLGPYILRTETVSAVVLGILRYHFDDL